MGECREWADATTLVVLSYLRMINRTTYKHPKPSIAR